MYFEDLDAPLVVKIAKLFFSQIKNLGHLLLNRESINSLITREDIIEQLKYLKYFLYFLEKEANLKFDEREIPLLYNTTSWRPDLGLGGFNSKDNTITFEQVLPSYYAAWLLQTDSKKTGHQQVFKAVLWVCQNKSVNEAIKYALLLQKSGYIIDSDLTESIIYAVLYVYRISKNDTEILKHFFKDSPPVSQTEWFDAFIVIDFDNNAEIIREVSEEIILTLIEEGLNECEELRNAKSYNDFFLTQTHLKVYLDLIYKNINYFVKNKSVFLVGILDQFEEILADFVAIKFFEYDYIYKWRMAESLLSNIQANDKEFIYRIIEERVLIPYELTLHTVNHRSLKDVPDSWKELSSPVSNLYLTIFFRKDFKTIWRKSFVSSQEVSENSFLDILNHYNIYESFTKNTLAFTKDFFVNAINLEAVPVLESIKNGFMYKSKIETLKDSKLKTKFEKWNEDYLPILKPDIDEIYNLFCYEDFFNKLEAAWHSPNNEDMSKKLHELCDLYPFHPLSLVELAIFFDEKENNPLEAYNYLEKALVLEPSNPNFWHSMSIILNNLDDTNSSKLIFRYKNWLEYIKSEII